MTVYCSSLSIKLLMVFFSKGLSLSSVNTFFLIIFIHFLILILYLDQLSFTTPLYCEYIPQQLLFQVYLAFHVISYFFLKETEDPPQCFRSSGCFLCFLTSEAVFQFYTPPHVHVFSFLVVTSATPPSFTSSISALTSISSFLYLA